MFLLFEVMDKHPSLPELWGICLFLGVAGFFMARKNPLFLVIISPLLLLFSVLYYSELNAPFIGDSIISEAGYGYVVQSYIAMFIGNLLPIVGFFVWLLKKEKTLS